MLSSLELAFFFKQLHFLVKRGISLYPAIELIRADIGSRSLGRPMDILLGGLREGSLFSEILYSQLRVPLFITNMIRVGENEGSLVNSLEKASDYLQGRIDLTRKIQNALLYPITLVLLGSGILVWILTQVLPQFKMIYEDAGVQLPLPTRVLFYVQGVMAQIWWKAPLVLMMIGAVMFFLFRRELPFLVSKVVYRIPLIGTFRYYFSVMNFVSNLGSLHGSGMSLIQSFQLTLSATHNLYLKSILSAGLTQIIEGRKLSDALHETGFFPAIVVRMMMAGEESGELDRVLMQLTDYLGEELDIRLQRFVALIGPLSLIVIGFFVAFMSLSFLLPLFRMTGVLRHM